MDKKSIIGIVLIGILFFGFTIYSSRQQQKYQEELAAYQAAHPELTQPVVPDSSAVAAAPVVESLGAATPDSTRLAREVAVLGDFLAAAKNAAPQEIVVENDVMKVRFSTGGGIVRSVTLKDYTRYGRQGERNEPIEMFVPESAKFDLSFFIKNGLNNVKVNTSEYTFTADPVIRTDTAQIVRMRLPVAEGAALEYRYVVYDEATPSRDYLVDYTVRLVGMAPYMANQSSIGIAWSNTSYQNERGFKNENMYTTVAYRVPGEGSIDDLSMSEGAKEEKISSSVEWIAFKQQFFSSVLIARDDFLYADVAYDTASPDSRLLVLLRSQQVRRVEEDRRRTGPIAAARPADPHGLGHYRVGEPLAGDPRLRFPAAVYSELRLDHPHPGDPHQDHRFAADLQELYLAGQDAHHQTRDRFRSDCR